jgi:hypothetical protein
VRTEMFSKKLNLLSFSHSKASKFNALSGYL